MATLARSSMSEPNSSNTASSSSQINNKQSLHIELFLGFYYIDIFASIRVNMVNVMTLKGVVYEQYRGCLNGECLVSEHDFQNTDPIKGDSMLVEALNLGTEGAQDLRYNCLPASFAKIDNSDVLNAYRRVCENIPDISALQKGERWTHLWQFFRDLKGGRGSSPTQELIEDNGSIVENSSDMQKPATRSTRVPPWDKVRNATSKEVYPEAVKSKRGWGSRESAYIMLFFALIRERGRENQNYTMPSAQQVTEAFNRFFQSEYPDYVPRKATSVGSFYRKRLFTRPIKDAADALATQGAEVFIPEITTARLDTFIAEQEWAKEEVEYEAEYEAEEERDEETDEETYQ